ncbi:MAG: aminoacyl-tRNA hydrolase [Chthonomonadales bacterium]
MASGEVPVKLIVGLGNPGPEYEGTRHNIGFEVVERLAERHRISVRRRELKSLLGEGRIEGQNVLLARPMTYMNLSGQAVEAILRRYGLTPQDLIVIVDDAALPPGKLRLRLKGSSGGHNGLASIEEHLGTHCYARIRIGVGPPPTPDLASHVLSRFSPAERPVMNAAVELASDAVELALREGFEKAMSRYNSVQAVEAADASPH